MTKAERNSRTFKARKMYAVQCKALGFKPEENYLLWGERRLTDDLQIKYKLAPKWRRRRALKKMGYNRADVKRILATL